MTICLCIGSLIPGPALCLIYNGIVIPHLSWAAGLFGQRVNVSIVIATFAFTMLGFLAAVIAVMVSLSGTRAFKQYKRREYLDIFLRFYFFAVVCLVATFALAILGFSKNGYPPLFNLTIMSAVNNLGQICLITYTIINIVRRAGGEVST